MDLHYSQTHYSKLSLNFRFTTLWIYTILKREDRLILLLPWFHYLMDLHYSQTPLVCQLVVIGVSLPYGFTLFSN